MEYVGSRSSGSGKKDQDVFKKALVLFKKGRYLFLKVLDLFKKRPYLLR